MPGRLDEDIDAALAGLDRALAAAPRSSAQAQAQALAPPGPDGPFPGVDATGTVRVTVDRRGEVVAVTIDLGWSRRLDADGLAGGLHSAYTAAVTGITAAVWPAVEHRVGTSVPSYAGTAVDVDDENWLPKVRAELGALQQERRRLARIPPVPPPDVLTATGGYGYLSAQGHGGDLVAVRAERGDLSRAPLARLIWEALAVMRAAQGLPFDAEPGVPVEEPDRSRGDDYGGWGSDSDWDDPHGWQRGR